MYKSIQVAVLCGIIALGSSQLLKARKAESQCWLNYQQTLQSCDGPMKEALGCVESSWDAYTSCSRTEGMRKWFP